jgi:hypothetical protein
MEKKSTPIPAVLRTQIMRDATTPEQGERDVAAIQLFADDHGEYWAEKLIDMWSSGRDDRPEAWRRYGEGALRRLRNSGCGLSCLFPADYFDDDDDDEYEGGVD